MLVNEWGLNVHQPQKNSGASYLELDIMRNKNILIKAGAINLKLCYWGVGDINNSSFVVNVKMLEEKKSEVSSSVMIIRVPWSIQPARCLQTKSQIIALRV